MSTITAYYRAYHSFNIPKDVFLLAEDHNETAEYPTRGMWWIKWGTLLYVADDEGRIREIQPSTEMTIESKYPDTIECD